MTSGTRDTGERLLARHEMFAGNLLRVFRDEVDLGGGRNAVREIIHHPGAAAVVAIADDGRSVLVRQWRHAVGRAMWELCAGTRDGEEDFEDCARRELAEETGYSASAWRSLGVGAVSPGYSNEFVHLFLARGLTAGSTALDEDEELEVGLFTQADVLHLISTGETDLKTVAGLALAGRLTLTGPL